MVLGSVAEMAHDVGQMHYLVKEMNHSFTTQFSDAVAIVAPSGLNSRQKMLRIHFNDRNY